MSKQIETATDFVVELSGGRGRDIYGTYSEAVAALRDAGCEEVGHSGDLEDGGDRTLAWLSAADAQDDDGQRVYAVIRARY